MSTIPSPMDHHLILLLLLLLLLQTLHVSIAQTIDPSPSQNKINTGFTTMTATIFAALLVIFALIAFVSIYFNRCAYGHNTTTGITTTRPSTIHVVTSDDTTNRHGLDQSILETFPIMEYSAVKGLNMVKGPLECAVCLSEFGSDESLRLLPGCCHVFHPDCIDKWLESHITCPVCRADLTKPTINTINIYVSADVNEEPITDRHLASAEVTNAFDRFTLRLPHHVRREIEDARRHRRAVSISGCSYDRRESGRSGRLWGIFRSFSLRRRADGDIGEGSFKRVFPVVEDAGAPANSQSSSGSRLEEESQSDAHASEMVVFDRV